MNTTNHGNVNREFKSSLFCRLFGESVENALSLYNAVNGSDYTDTEDFVFTTLEDVIYMKMKNDVSFLFDKTLNLYEHQSTYNPNMPLRGFLYHADLYKKLIKKSEQIYSRYLLKLPAPRYIVFYNGTDRKMTEDVMELHLSDAFEGPFEKGKFEWTATMININQGHSPELAERCAVLRDYMEFVDKIRSYSKEMTLRQAVDRTVDECIKSGVLEDFLSTHRREVSNMLLTEFDEEKYIEMMKTEEREFGMEAGRKAGIEAGIEIGHKAGIEDGIEIGRMDGMLQAYLSLIKKGLLTLATAAQELGMSEDALLEKMQ